jgi:hypothetical protein
MLTFYEVFTGHWTWTQMLREIWPLISVAASAFFAGYWRGRNVEFRENHKEVK